MQSEDTRLATFASWTLGLVVFTLTGFYLGSIAGHDNHPHLEKHKDLDPIQLAGAIPFTIAGLTIGILFALMITFWYTPVKLREIANEEGGHH
ncbi:hypothetical protein EON82_09980 [bacterium]|nr:MAG: hypothetical protein EON82_09980 [bacterium]